MSLRDDANPIKRIEIAFWTIKKKREDRNTRETSTWGKGLWSINETEERCLGLPRKRTHRRLHKHTPVRPTRMDRYATSSPFWINIWNSCHDATVLERVVVISRLIVYGTWTVYEMVIYYALRMLSIDSRLEKWDQVLIGLLKLNQKILLCWACLITVDLHPSTMAPCELNMY